MLFTFFFLAPKHKSIEKRESPSPAPKPRKVELSESGTFQNWPVFSNVCDNEKLLEFVQLDASTHCRYNLIKINL